MMNRPTRSDGRSSIENVRMRSTNWSANLATPTVPLVPLFVAGNHRYYLRPTSVDSGSRLVVRLGIGEPIGRLVDPTLPSIGDHRRRLGRNHRDGGVASLLLVALPVQPSDRLCIPDKGRNTRGHRAGPSHDVSARGAALARRLGRQRRRRGSWCTFPT